MNAQFSPDWACLLETGSESEALAWIASQTRDSVAGLRTGGLLPSRTPLMVAASVSASLVKALLPISDALEASASDKKTALMIAAAAGRADCVEALLPHSDANAIEHWRDRTALMLAAVEGHDECVRILAPKSNLSQQESLGLTALMTACAVGRWECVRWLADEATARDVHPRTKMTALHMIAQNHMNSPADLLKCLDCVLPQSDAMALDIDGKTAFEHAVSALRWAVAFAIAKSMDIGQEIARWDCLSRIVEKNEKSNSTEKNELIVHVAKHMAASGQAAQLETAFENAVLAQSWASADALSRWASPEDIIAARDRAAALGEEALMPQISSRAQAIELREAADAAASASDRAARQGENADLTPLSQHFLRPLRSVSRI